MRIAVIGCGMISDIYLTNMIKRFQNLEVAGCAASHFENAEQKAKKYGIKAMTVEEVMADESIEMVVNLTPTPAHYEIVKTALLAGKHVFTEKALAETMQQGEELLKIAEEKGLYLGCAPETFLGSAVSKAKELIAGGELGEITGFHAMLNINISEMYPKYRILTMPGASISLDRGVYFLTQLCYLLGEADEVKGFERILEPDRELVMEDGTHKQIHLQSANQAVAAIRLKSGVEGTINLNGNTIFPELSHTEIYGTKGIMEIPDANHFGGNLRLLESGDADTPRWKEISCSDENIRGIGPSKMAEAIAAKKPNPIDAKLAYHVMSICHKIGK